MSTQITNEQLKDFENILRLQNKSHNTIAAYSINIRKLVAFLNGSELTGEKMKAYRMWLEEQGFKKRTINAYLSAANYFCDFIGHSEMKVDLINLDYLERHTKHQISSDDYNKLVYTALQNNKERLAMMIQVLCLVDIRYCELAKLTVEALKVGYVEVERKSTLLHIQLSEIMIRDLEIYIQHEQIINGIIFCTINGKLVDRSNFRKEIKNLCVLANVDEEFGTIQHVKNVVVGEYPYHGLKK